MSDSSAVSGSNSMTDSQRWLVLGVLVFLGFLISLLKPILTPFLVATLLAYLGDPAADKLEKYGLSRSLSVSVVFLVFSVVLTFFLFLLIPLLGSQLQVLQAKIPLIVDWVLQTALPWLQVQLGVNPEVARLESVKDVLAENWQQTQSLIKNIVLKVSGSGMALTALLANLALIPVVTFYLLRDWDHLLEKIQNLLPRSMSGTVVKLAKECDEVLGAFFRGQLLIMFLLGCIYALGLWFVGLELALLIGMIAGLASIVPYLGFIVGITAASIAALFQFHDGNHLIYVAIVFGIGQMLEGMILTPLLVGDRIGLHPVAVIFAVLAGGQLFGFVGVLLALPVAAVIMVLLRYVHETYKNSELYQSAS